MAVQAVERLASQPAEEALRGHRAPVAGSHSPSLALVMGLQRSAGNAAVARHLGRSPRPHVAARPPSTVQVQRCGPVACDCSAEERSDYAEKHPEQEPSDSGTVQRWPFSDEEEQSEESSGGITGWLADQAGSAADAVSDAAGGAVDWATDQAGAAADVVGDVASGAADAVSGAVSGAADWATEQAGAAVEAVAETASGVEDWAEQQAAAVIDEKRAALLAQIAGARGQLSGLDTLPIQSSQLATLNGHLASLRASSSGQIAIPAVAPDGSSPDSESAVSAGTIDALLASLQSSLAGPTSKSPTQRSVQRYAAPPPPVAPVLTLAVILIIIAIVLLVLALIALAIYLATRKPELKPEPKPKPDEQPKVDPKEKEKKRKRCMPDRDCRETGLIPCPESLPLAWPLELPLPGFERLVRVKNEDVDFPKERRGGAQARLQKEIAENRSRLLPPPRPCFPVEGADPNEPRDAHHRHPLALGGLDADNNLCSLEADAHQTGHPRLANQIEFLDEHRRECCYCSPNINLHPAGQDYFIQGRK